MSSVSDDDDEDDEVDLYRQRKLKGDGDDSASSQAVLLYQGVARLPNADGNNNEEYVLTVVEDIFDTTREVSKLLCLCNFISHLPCFFAP